MAYLHNFSPPIIHRDLKPANLLVTKTLQVKICDFGLSVQKTIIGVGTDDGSSPRTSSPGADGEGEDDDTGGGDQLGGTAPYSAPEVLLGKELDTGCDVFSFGVITWEMFSRRRPWHGVHVARISQLVGLDDERLPISDEVASLGDGSIKAIVEECWQLKPGDRPKFQIPAVPASDASILSMSTGNLAGAAAAMPGELYSSMVCLWGSMKTNALHRPQNTEDSRHETPRQRCPNARPAQPLIAPSRPPEPCCPS